MSNKASSKVVCETDNVSSGSGKQLQVVFGRLHNLYVENKKLWKEIMILQENNNELRNLIKKVA